MKESGEAHVEQMKFLLRWNPNKRRCLVNRILEFEGQALNIILLLNIISNQA